METLNKKFVGLINKCAKKNNLIKADLNPIYDGLLGNEKEWKKQDTRIMWVLKEAYDEVDNGKPKGGGWSFEERLSNEKDSFPFGEEVESKNTWLNMLYVSYGIQKGFSKLPKNEFGLNEDINVDEAILKKIAFINVSKMPGKKNTKMPELKPKFEIWEEILMKQIKEYEPNIIIFGGTFELFDDILKLGTPLQKGYLLNKNHKAKFKVSAYKKDDIVYIDTYHPLRISHEGVNKILKIIADIKKK